MSRIGILFIAIALCFSCKQELPEKIAHAKKPNILFIMADDHAKQAISAYGHPIAKLAPYPKHRPYRPNGAHFQKSLRYQFYMRTQPGCHSNRKVWTY